VKKLFPISLLVLGYTSCGQRCDFQSEVMGIVQNALRSTPFGDDIHHATISANPDIDTPEALSRYIKAQNLDTSKNRINESGISFHHKILDDLGRTAIAVHYDHGNAVAIADVDSDGLMDMKMTERVILKILLRPLAPNCGPTLPRQLFLIMTVTDFLICL